jgi:hypothetical protein
MLSSLDGWSQGQRDQIAEDRFVETLRGYVRDAELFTDHAGAGLL